MGVCVGWLSLKHRESKNSLEKGHRKQTCGGQRFRVAILKSAMLLTPFQKRAGPAGVGLVAGRDPHRLGGFPTLCTLPSGITLLSKLEYDVRLAVTVCGK